MNSLALLPNLMGPDGLVIFLFILLFFGAKRLPELAKGLGSAVREFSKAKDEIEHEITRAPTPQIQPPATRSRTSPPPSRATQRTSPPSRRLPSSFPLRSLM